jgi:hypothetical protein
MAKPKILISLMTEADTANQAFGRTLLEYLYGKAELAPEHVGNYEPVANRAESVDDALLHWRNSLFMWARRHSITSQGTVFHRSLHGQASIIFEATYRPTFDWWTLFVELAGLTKAQYGYLHLVTDQERARSDLGPQRMQSFSLGAFSKTVSQGLLQLGWADHFGTNWFPLINMDRISLDAAKIDRSSGSLTFSVTPRLDDVVSNYDDFDNRRNTLKQAFSAGVFAPDSGGCGHAPG